MSLNVTLYDSIVEQGMKLKPREREAFWRAVIEYMAYQTEPSLTGTPDICFGLIRPTLDRQRARAEAGSNGGAKRAYNSKQTAKQTPSKRASNCQANGQANSKQNPSELEEEVEVRTKSKSDLVLSAPAPEFEPPTVGEVRAEAQMRGCGNVDAEQFVAYYASQGWVKANGQPVTDWRNLLVSWRNRQAEIDAKRPRKGVTADEFAEYAV